MTRTKLTKAILETEHLTNELTPWEIGQKYGYHEATIHRKMTKFGIKKIKRQKHRRSQLAGKKIGKLLVIEYSHSDAQGRSFWKCKCDCGNEIVKKGKYLSSRETKSCGQCRYLLPYFIYGCIETEAARRGKPFNVTYEYLEELLDKQDCCCALSGEKLYIPQHSREMSTKTASLDRIDNDKGYVEGNLQWVHKKVNYMKHTSTQDEFIEWCRKIVSHAESRG